MVGDEASTLPVFSPALPDLAGPGRRGGHRQRGVGEGLSAPTPARWRTLAVCRPRHATGRAPSHSIKRRFVIRGLNGRSQQRGYTLPAQYTATN